GLALLDLGAAFARGAELALGVDADLLQLGELAAELLEEVRGGFERAAFVFQRGDLAGDAVPVELVEGGEFFQPGEGVEAAGEGAALGVDATDAAAELAEAGLELAALGFEGLDLGGVAPAQHVAAAVGDGVAVVLLVAAAGVLDLAGAGDRARLAAELL